MEFIKNEVSIQYNFKDKKNGIKYSVCANKKYWNKVLYIQESLII